MTHRDEFGELVDAPDVQGRDVPAGFEYVGRGFIRPTDAPAREDVVGPLLRDVLERQRRTHEAATRIRVALAEADAGGYSGAWYFYMARADVEALLDTAPDLV